MALGVDEQITTALDQALGPRTTDMEFLRAAADMSGDRHDRYVLASQYYDGAQKTKLTDRVKAYLDMSGIGYQENFCQTVVDALAERLILTGLTTDLEEEDETTGDKTDELADWLWRTFDRNQGDELQTSVHTAATEYGDAYVIVDFDSEAGRPRLTFNDPELIKPVYEDGQLTYVVKVWESSQKSPTNPTGKAVRRMNIYYPDRVEKWFTVSKDGGGDWVEWLDDGQQVWPMPWQTPDGDPLGIPVFHFANARRSDMFGRPEHWGTIPQQDRLNKELIDLANVLDHEGFPQRYATGMTDTAGLTTDPGTVWSTDNAQAAFGQFDAADPSGILKSVESTLIRIATRSRTPAHLIYLSGGLPSGEALKTAEAGLVAKAKKRHIYHGNTWVGVFKMTTTLAVAFGSADEKPAGIALADISDLSINVRWEDPETRNEKEHLESLTLMSTLGVSQETILSMIPGIDPAEERKRKERAAPDIGAAGAAMMDGLENPLVNPPEVSPNPPPAGQNPFVQ